VAAQTGLAENLTVTPVRFSWEQLERAQDRWRPRLSDLFGRREATTALAPDTNSVEINLSSTVPSPKRAELHRAAAADRVSASIDVEPASSFDIVPAEKCAEFKSRNAGCAPSITSGLTIKDEKGEDCTAGPLLIRKDRSTGAKATETFVLTAGHCLKSTGGVGKPFTALTTGLLEKPLGTSVDYLMPGIPGIDVGVIKVESAYWAPEEDPPVKPHRAAWSAEKETEPVTVTGEANPVKGTVSCLSGERSGVQCGTVENANMELPMEYTLGEGTLLEGMAQINLESGKAGGGDSGSPVFSQASPGVIQGHTVAVAFEGKTEEGKVAYFHLLSVSLAKLGEYELLTSANEKRHKGGFGAEAEHVVLTRSANTTQKFTPSPGGATVECTTMSIDNATAQSSSTAVETVEFEPTYSNCEPLLGAAVTVSTNGCKYVLHLASEKTSGSADIECPGGKPMEIKVGALCTYTIGTQTGLNIVNYSNTGSGATREVVAAPNLTGVTSTRLGSKSCAAGTKEGTYTGEITITGENSKGKHVGIFVD
jgi:hypothetical protein